MSASVLVNGERVEAPAGLIVEGSAEGAHAFAPRGRRASATAIVVHETVTTSVEATIAALETQGFGAHLVIGPGGEVSQHGDLALDVLWHAGPALNGQSIGIEVVSPYTPRLLREGMPWREVIEAPWANGGRYVLPTLAQAEAITAVLRWLTGERMPGIAVPRRWPGIRDGRAWLARVPGLAPRETGILAHQYVAHADGAFLVLHAWLRIEHGLEAAEAFAEAKRLVTGARQYADIRELSAG